MITNIEENKKLLLMSLLAAEDIERERENKLTTFQVFKIVFITIYGYNI